MEVCGSEEVGIIGKLEKLMACGGRKEIKEKEKGKEITKEKIFSWKRI